MKNYFPVAICLFLLLTSTTAKSQSTPDQRAFRLSLLSPAVSFEHRIAGAWSAEGRVNLAGFSGGSGSNWLRAESSLALNYQYNLRKRVAAGKSLHHFSGNFLSFRNSYHGWLSDNPEVFSPGISTHTLEHLWRRSVGQSGFVEFGVGGGVYHNFRNNTTGLTPSLRLGIGFAF